MSLSRFPLRTLPSEGTPPRGFESLLQSPAPFLDPRRFSHGTLGPPRGTIRPPAPFPAASGLASGSPTSASDAFARGIEEELTRLRDENANLKAENAELQGRVNGIEYVPSLSYSIHAIHDIYRNARNDLLEELCAKIDTTRAEVHDIAQNISTIDNQADSIPLNPKQEDYPDLGYWRSEPWLTLRSGTGPKTVSTSTLCLYMEDEFGRLVDSEVRDEVLADARGFWADCLRKGREDELLGSKKYGLDIKEDFRLALEKKHPWLRLCSGHWKVYQVWTNHFGSWKNNNMTKSDNKKGPVIVISSDNEDNGEATIVLDSDDTVTKTGKKRNNPDDADAGSSKRHKGKQVAQPDFHPPRPQPRPKANAKTNAKVCKHFPSRCLQAHANI